MAEQSDAPEAESARYDRLCERFERLIEEWLSATAVDVEKKDWAQQLASMTLAAQRVAGLRALLTDRARGETREGSDHELEDQSAEMRRHWEALTRESPDDPGAHAG